MESINQAVYGVQRLGIQDYSEGPGDYSGTGGVPGLPGPGEDCDLIYGSSSYKGSSVSSLGGDPVYDRDEQLRNFPSTGPIAYQSPGLSLPQPEQKAGRKLDSGKAPVSQGLFAYFPDALLAVANISKYGKQKYGVEYADQNWKRVENAHGRYADAQGRHELLPYSMVDHNEAELADPTLHAYDEESGHLHAAHEAWNALARLQMLLEGGMPEKYPQ